MTPSFSYQSKIIILLLGITFSFSSNAQTYDTISNWENVMPEWMVNAGSGGMVVNPAPDVVNVSEHCMQVVTNTDPYNLICVDLNESVDFDKFPRYGVSVLAPPSGGDVSLKFESIDNSSSKEVRLTPVPGQWNRLTFDFSGMAYQNYTRMVILVDILGTEPDKVWYFDDVVKEIPPPLEFTSNMPIIVIDTYGVSIPDEPKIPGFMGIIDNGPGQVNNINDPFNHYNGHIGIEIRGQSSQRFPKKAYSMETRKASGENQNVPLLGMPSENDWVLYAPYSDKSMLRNTMTFEMARQMTGYASRTRYCEVVVNGDYKGIYVLMERIKRDKNRVNIEKLNPDEISGENLSGGYIIRVDKMDWDFNYATDGWLSEVTPFYPSAKRQTFQFFYPKAKIIVPQQRDYIKNFVTLAEEALVSSGFNDPFSGYPAYIDLPSFVDFMLLNEISKEVDNYKFSTYFYKENDRDGGKLFAGPAWDFNLGYGNVNFWPDGLKTTGWLYQTVTTGNPDMMYWWERLMEDSYFRDLAKTRWVDLRLNTLTNTFIQQKVDSLIGEIDEAKERNFARWPILGEYVWPNHDWENNTYADEVEYFTSFLNNRLEYMDINMPGNVLQSWVGISALANKISLTLYGDYFRRPLLSKEQFSLLNAPGYLSIQDVSYISPISCILTLNADVSAMGSVSVKVMGNSVNTLKDIESNKLSTTGISSPDKQIQLNIYASGNIIYLDCSLLKESGHAEVINILGQKCGELPLQSESLNSFNHNLIPGVYFVVVKSNNFSGVQRVVILQ